jgi:predicted membrane protein
MAVIKIFKLQEELRKLLYFVCGVLIQIGIFSMRWNVVIGGQLFSKSFRGLTTYNMELMGIEGFLVALILMIAPFFVLAILMRLLPPWKKGELVGD